MSFDKKEFAANLRAIRARLDVSQAEFAKLAGVSADAIVKYESGNSYIPGVDKVMAICDAGHVSPNELLGWK